MDLGNVNTGDEQQKSNAIKGRNQLFGEQEDLHMALKSCNEIGSAKTLHAFLLDLQKIPGSKVPSQ